MQPSRVRSVLGDDRALVELVVQTEASDVQLCVIPGVGSSKRRSKTRIAAVGGVTIEVVKEILASNYPVAGQAIFKAATDDPACLCRTECHRSSIDRRSANSCCGNEPSSVTQVAEGDGARSIKQRAVPSVTNSPANGREPIHVTAHCRRTSRTNKIADWQYRSRGILTYTGPG